MPGSRLRLPLVVFWLVSSAAANLWAQAETSAIRGKVTDPKGLPVPGVEIVATDLSTGVEHRTVSREDGNYFLTALPLSRYGLRASLSGFRTFENPSVQVRVATTALVNVELQVGEVQEK